MDISIIICTVAAISSMIIAGVSLTMACICWSKVVGMEKSTHQIQYVPLHNEEGKELTGEALDENIKRALSQEYNVERDYL